MWRFSIILIAGCSDKEQEDICFGAPVADAEQLQLDIISWESGPVYDEPVGWTGEIYLSEEEWQGFLTEQGLDNPLTSVEHSLFDVLLYERIYNGCDYEVVFDGAYLYEGTRFIRAKEASLDVFCDLYSPEHAVLLLEKRAGTDVEVCSLDWD